MARTNKGVTVGRVTFVRPSDGNPKRGIGQASEWWFLEQPAPIVLAVMWLAGAVIIILGGLAVYSLWSLLWWVAGV